MTTAEQKWDRKYELQAEPPSDPDSFLAARLNDLKPGSVLDIACGSGRNSIFLAAKGFTVTGMDISQVALEKLDRIGRDKALSIKTEKIDLENPSLDLTSHLEGYDNVVVINFKLSQTLLATIPQLLKKNGIFIYCTFNLRHHQKHGFKKAFCIEPGQYHKHQPSLKLLHFEDREEDYQFRDGYMFLKR